MEDRSGCSAFFVLVDKVLQVCLVDLAVCCIYVHVFNVRSKSY